MSVLARPAVAIFIAAFSLGALGCSAPVDISGVPDLPASGPPEPRDVMPSELLGSPLTDMEDVSDIGDVSLNGRYGDVRVILGRAQSSSIASSILEDEYSGLQERSGSWSSTRVGDWFTYSGSGLSVFWWQKGTWFFGMLALDDESRDNAARALIDHLVSLEG